MQPLTVQIEGMTCGHCVEEVTGTLKALNSVHVHSVQVGSATVSFDPSKISPDGIVKAIAALGYKITQEPSREPETKELSMNHDQSAQQHHPAGHQAPSPLSPFLRQLIALPGAQSAKSWAWSSGPIWG